MSDAAKRAIEMQRAVMMQQQTAASYLKDMDKWEQDIQLQDVQLQQTSKLVKVCVAAVDSDLDVHV